MGFRVKMGKNQGFQYEAGLKPGVAEWGRV